jgi:hypothetical protein
MYIQYIKFCISDVLNKWLTTTHLSVNLPNLPMLAACRLLVAVMEELKYYYVVIQWKLTEEAAAQQDTVVKEEAQELEEVQKLTVMVVDAEGDDLDQLVGCPHDLPTSVLAGLHYCLMRPMLQLYYVE